MTTNRKMAIVTFTRLKIDGITALNLLERNFHATKPDEKWGTDITEFKVYQQKVYLSPIVDLFTQEVVAYKVAKNAMLSLVTEM